MTLLPEVGVDVCVCTFRRPEPLKKTLKTIADLILSPDLVVNVIVADNDEAATAKKMVEELAQTFPFPLLYIHAPARNISIARNACLDAAKGSYIAFIDDDETAPPDWLNGLVQRQRLTKADVILGPVQSIYPPGAAAWLRDEDFHSIRPVWVKNRIITGYTSNVLFLRSAPALKDKRFDLAFGQSGGEDTQFFGSAVKDGATIEYADQASVIEEVACNRLTMQWLLKRSFRSGQTHGTFLLQNSRISLIQRFLDFLVALSKAIYCGLMVILSFVTRESFRRWALRGTLHLGVVVRLMGMREVKQYG